MQGRKRTRSAELNEESEEISLSKKLFSSEEFDESNGERNILAGKVKKVKVCNFMCHKHLEFDFGDRINFISGKNGSGKSAILTALVIGLGGKTSDTNRGHSLKNLIKNGENSGSIEITLHNRGKSAYNKHIYGNEITITRKFSEKSSTYKFFNDKGNVVALKRNELEFMLLSLNIQINNPICILNQDDARTFLKSTSPKEFYRLFRKGTLLEHISDKIDKFCNERLPYCNELHVKYSKELQDRSKDLLELKRKRENQEELRKNEKELENHRIELHWSYVSTLESDIEKENIIIEEYIQSLQNIASKVKKRDTSVTELKQHRKILEEKLNSIKGKNQVNENIGVEIESEYLKSKELLSKKVNEIMRFESKKKNAIKNCLDLEALITKQQSEAKEIAAKQKQKEIEKKEIEKAFEEMKSVLSTTDLHRQQLLDTVNACSKNVSQKSRFLDNLSNTIKHKEQYLASLKKDKNQLSVYASWMPNLINALEIAYKKGKFEHMPRGPLGRYMKLKEKDWGPAIESFFGGGTLRSFCVNSSKDYHVFNSILDEMNIRKNQRPTIIISKFFSKVHDLSGKETKSNKYVSLLRILDISDVVVTNSLIDQWRIERIILIPTSEEAYPLMENINNVPVNCERALVKTGDIFFPQPNYKSYAGTVNEQARYLQVNPENIIRLTEDELRTTRDEYKLHQEQMQELDKKFKSSRKGLDEAEREVKRLTNQLAKYEVELVEINQQNDTTGFNDIILKEDLTHWKGNLNSCEKSIKELESTKESYLEKTKELKKKLKEFEDDKRKVSEELGEIEEELKKVKSELLKVNQHHDHYLVQLKNEERKSEDHKNKLKLLKEEHTKAKKAAEEACPERNENPRDPKKLENKITELKRMIFSLNKLVSDEIIEPADYELRMSNFEKAMNSLKVRGNLIKQFQKISGQLPKKLEEITFRVGCNTDSIFRRVLREKNFLGKLDIDHDKQRLNIIVKPDPKADSESPISTLSGGERSFSMVAFILALWENMSSPFYFLDEFDVFLDEVNRKLVMDLLISTARLRPNQYVFLTPHSTFAEEDSAIVNFFRMKDPREDG